MLDTAFLIGMSLTACCKSRTDDPNTVFAAICVSDEDKPLPRGLADCNESPLVNRMVWVVKRLREWIEKHRLRFVERDAVPPLVRSGFLGVPFVNHGTIVARRVTRQSPRPTCNSTRRCATS